MLPNPQPKWWFRWSLITISQLVTEIFLSESVNWHTNGRTNRRLLESQPISSPRAFGSGELKIEFWHTPRVKGVCGQIFCYHSAAFVIPFHFISNMTMFWKIRILTFNPTSRVGGGGGGGVCWQKFCYHVAAFVITFNLICNMPMFWKRWILIFWPHPKGRGEGSGWQTICNLVATFLVPFKLICNMAMFWKTWIWPFDPTPKSTRGVEPRISIQNHLWYVSYSMYLCLHAQKILKTELLLNLNIWPLTPSKGSVGWGEVLITVMFII